MTQPMAAGVCFNPQQDCKNVWEIKKTGRLCATTQTPRQYHYNIHEIVFRICANTIFQGKLAYK